MPRVWGDGLPGAGTPGCCGAGVLVCWRIKKLGTEVLGNWSVGVLGHWDVGMLGCWGTGMLECWGIGMLGNCSVRILGC